MVLYIEVEVSFLIDLHYLVQLIIQQFFDLEASDLVGR